MNKLIPIWLALPAMSALSSEGGGGIPVARMAHTYSIVARDPATGDLGVAVQSHWFSVGSVVAWAEPGVGAVATQSIVEVSYGPLGLALLKAGRSPEQALRALLAGDPQPEVRQVAMVDAEGRVAAHTGAKCILSAGHVAGEGFSVQANLMRNDTIWPAMASAYREAKGDLADRMLAALDAAEAAGGDIRGRQSAALKIVRAKATGKPWADVIYDVRVDDSPTPLPELRRLVRLQSAYIRANRGDELMAESRVDEALKEYAAAAELAPEIEELPFWQAVSLVGIGKIEDALPIFRDVFARNGDYRELVSRLPKAGLLPDDPEAIARIRAVK